MLYAGAERQMLEVRDVIRRPEPPATAEFATLPARLIKIVSSLALAPARVIETASWVRLAVAAGHFVAVLFTSLMSGLELVGPSRTGPVAWNHPISSIFSARSASA